MTGAGKQRLNGEIITGIALAFLATIFIFAGSMNPVWAIILPADYLLLAIGIGFIVIGSMTVRRSNRAGSHPEHTSRY